MARTEWQDLMSRFASLGYAMVGYGPRHPELPFPELQAEIDDFFAENPLLKRDQGYVDFLEMYSSAYVEWPSKDFFALIYGFNPGANIYIPRPDESLIEGHGFFRFAELGLGPVEEDDSVGIDFAWDITGERRDGVYRQITTMADYDGDWRNIPYIWYCETFIEWFERLVIGPAELLK